MQELTQIVSDLRDKLACSEHENFSLKEINESLNSKIEKLERELNAIKTEIEKQSIITKNFTNLCSPDLHSASTQTETAVQDTTYISNPYEQNKESCKILILGDSQCRHYSNPYYEQNKESCKILILGDSQCRHYSKLLRDPLDDNFELFGMIKPNAKIGTLVQNIENE
ncbi:hypothetical protein QE152_g27103 [Popillia japonica]|uniref:Uncharacterized protein n=1 Tax=Popillia japonica TaxID=7064 RepID=A0AAW1JXB1_POPJA